LTVGQIPRLLHHVAVGIHGLLAQGLSHCHAGLQPTDATLSPILGPRLALPGALARMN
jgi:hypothetical protein